MRRNFAMSRSELTYFFLDLGERRGSAGIRQSEPRHFSDDNGGWRSGCRTHVGGRVVDEMAVGIGVL